MSLIETFDRLGRPRMLVLGDLMLDRYTWGSASRTSQEAPVLVLRAEHREHRPGGASNVGLMLGVLESHVTCAGVIGQDEAGETLIGLLQSAGIQTQGILRSTTRPTTLKERFVGRSGSGLPSQILRVDTEQTRDLDPATETELREYLMDEIPQHDAVLISDYAKGVCTPGCLAAVIQAAQRAKVPVLVDPGRGRDFGLYRAATLIKPNRNEIEVATGQTIDEPRTALAAGQALCQQLDLEMAVVTLDADGMALAHRQGGGQLFPTKARSVYDITGAGDMVLAVLGLGLAEGIPPDHAVLLANTAAGLEVDRTGVTPLTRAEIRAELQFHTVHSRRKITELGQLGRLAEEYRRRGQRIVLTNGCFDLLHVGHATYLEEAASQGDILVVAINSDASVGRLKGAGRPVIGQHERAAMLAALGCVDHVLVFDEDTPHEVLRGVRPDVLVKGGSYAPHEVVGREIVESYGGRIYLAGMVPGVSTTEIVDSLRNQVWLRQAG